MKKVVKTDRKEARSIDSIRQTLLTDNEFVKELFQKFKDISEEVSIPVCVFSSKLTVFEACVKYLKEDSGKGFDEISDLLNRGKNNVTATYKKASKKLAKRFDIVKCEKVPVSIFAGKLSFLESIVVELKDKGMRYSEIARLLSRDQRTIWTVYMRAKKK